ncbi:carboxypeptidase-like regulatory domain-containing protein [Maribacter sp. R77961]|uniref:carboxypeptidase-like regulatory domain-containing protein n=1 Tax=Maribacter sp. R77961 TaxID=3093871 RepID=UPI0037C62BF0
MKNALRITVKKPCSENFENFDETKKGGFCLSCNLEVIDFRAMSEKALMNHFRSSEKKTCGRFKTSQLKSYETTTANRLHVNQFAKHLGMLSFSLLSLCVLNTINAQDSKPQLPQNISRTSFNTDQSNISPKIAQGFTVKGTVLDEENLPLPGANVFLKGTKVGVSTDFDGKFEFPQALEVGDVLLFSYLGYETKEYIVPESSTSVLDITINFDFADVELMGEVVIDGVYSSKRTFFEKVADLFR